MRGGRFPRNSRSLCSKMCEVDFEAVMANREILVERPVKVGGQRLRMILKQV